MNLLLVNEKISSLDGDFGEKVKSEDEAEKVILSYRCVF